MAKTGANLAGGECMERHAHLDRVMHWRIEGEGTQRLKIITIGVVERESDFAPASGLGWGEQRCS
jgi:hypothetical protein